MKTTSGRRFSLKLNNCLLIKLWSGLSAWANDAWSGPQRLSRPRLMLYTRLAVIFAICISVEIKPNANRKPTQCICGSDNYIRRAHRTWNSVLSYSMLADSMCDVHAVSDTAGRYSTCDRQWSPPCGYRPFVYPPLS